MGISYVIILFLKLILDAKKAFLNVLGVLKVFWFKKLIVFINFKMRSGGAEGER